MADALSKSRLNFFPHEMFKFIAFPFINKYIK